jgi:hypothetical protein
LVDLFKTSTISKAMFWFINKLPQCQLFIIFFAGHHIFISIQAMLYFGFDMIFAAFTNISGSFQKICITSGFSIFAWVNTLFAIDSE